VSPSPSATDRYAALRARFTERLTALGA
jgi:hypothetical protein